MYNSSSTYTKAFKVLAFFCGCINHFLLDLVGNPRLVFTHRGSFLYTSAHFYILVYQVDNKLLRDCNIMLR